MTFVKTISMSHILTRMQRIRAINMKNAAIINSPDVLPTIIN